MKELNKQRAEQFMLASLCLRRHILTYPRVCIRHVLNDATRRGPFVVWKGRRVIVVEAIEREINYGPCPFL